MDCTVKIKGADAVIKALTEMDKTTKAQVVDVMRAGGLQIKADAQKSLYKGHGVDTGTLRRSITSKTTATDSRISTVVGSNLHYAPHVEFGTRPHMPPSSALVGWSKRHGNRSIMRKGKAVKPNPKQTAYAIALKIKASGTTGLHYMENAYNANVDRIFRRVRDVVRQMEL